MDFEAPKIYEPIASFQELEEKLKMYQDQYNETVRGSKMDLVFFQVWIGFLNKNQIFYISKIGEK